LDPVRRVGHKGADLIEPGNTLASFDAALAHGVDMIELDVLPGPVAGERPGSASGPLILAHDYEDAGEREPLSLEEGLSHLASEPFAGIDFIVDLKLPGYEARVIEALGKAGLKDRAIISTTYRNSLLRLREADPGVRVAWSVPRARRDYTRSVLMAGPALAALRVMRRTLPRRAGACATRSRPTGGSSRRRSWRRWRAQGASCMRGRSITRPGSASWSSSASRA
jgi:glycerophosphoryl diester phosphodiesterase